MTADKRIKQILPPSFVASPDQEAWVKARIGDAMQMYEHLNNVRGVAANDLAANDLAVRLATQGIIEGMAIEIIKTLGGEPCYVNLPPPAGYPRRSEGLVGMAREVPPAPNPIKISPKSGIPTEKARPGDDDLKRTMPLGPAPGADTPTDAGLDPRRTMFGNPPGLEPDIDKPEPPDDEPL